MKRINFPVKRINFPVWFARKSFWVRATVLQENEEKVVVEESFPAKNSPDDGGKGSGNEPPESSSLERWVIKVEQSVNIFLTVRLISSFSVLLNFCQKVCILLWLVFCWFLNISGKNNKLLAQNWVNVDSIFGWSMCFPVYYGRKMQSKCFIENFFFVLWHDPHYKIEMFASIPSNELSYTNDLDC